MLKGEITEKGMLIIERNEVIKKQTCPFNPEWYCGDWCPHFREPLDHKDGSGSVTIFLTCGASRVLEFDRKHFTDYR